MIDEANEAAAYAAMRAYKCGLAVGSERILCDDPRAGIDRDEHCECRAAAKAAVTAFLKRMSNLLIAESAS